MYMVLLLLQLLLLLLCPCCYYCCCLHSYFESYDEQRGGLPVLRVVKELVLCT